MHVSRTPYADRGQVLCKWCATCATWLLHCATTSCTLCSHLSFCSRCAWATMDQQLQQLQQLPQLPQASVSGSARASSRLVQASRSGSASTSTGLTTPKEPQVDEQPGNRPTEQPSPLRLQPHFPCKSELLLLHSCHMDAPLTDESLELRLLRHVTPKYLYRRALYRWLKKCRQIDPGGIITYPWQTSALTATRPSDSKIVRIGLPG